MPIPIPVHKRYIRGLPTQPVQTVAATPSSETSAASSGGSVRSAGPANAPISQLKTVKVDDDKAFKAKLLREVYAHL